MIIRCVHAVPYVLMCIYILACKTHLQGVSACKLLERQFSHILCISRTNVHLLLMTAGTLGAFESDKLTPHFENECTAAN